MHVELALVCWLALGAEPSAADKAKAKTAFQAAQKAYDLGNFREALKGFSTAYELDSKPAFLFNIGQCHRGLGEHERAVFFFERYLSLTQGKAPNDKQARDLLAEENAKLKQTPPVAPPPGEPIAAPVPPGLEPAPFPTAGPPPVVPLVPANEPEVAKDEGGGITGKWWFWTAIGVVAVGAVTGGALAVSRPQPRGTTLESYDFRQEGAPR
jgi:hypothetical protein